MRKFWRWMAVTDALNAAASCTHFQLVKMVNFMWRIFYHKKKERRFHPKKKNELNELCKWNASVRGGGPLISRIRASSSGKSRWAVLGQTDPGKEERGSNHSPASWTVTFVIKWQSEMWLPPCASFCQSMPRWPQWAAGCPTRDFLELYWLPEPQALLLAVPPTQGCRSGQHDSQWLLTMTAVMLAGREEGERERVGTPLSLRVTPGRTLHTSLATETQQTAVRHSTQSPPQLKSPLLWKMERASTSDNELLLSLVESVTHSARTTSAIMRIPWSGPSWWD